MKSNNNNSKDLAEALELFKASPEYLSRCALIILIFVTSLYLMMIQGPTQQHDDGHHVVSTMKTGMANIS